MNKLLYLLFLSIFVLDYLSIKLHLISRYVSWLPEIFSILILFIIPARFMLLGGKNIPPKCAFFLILFLFNVIIGIIINIEPAGPLIAGLRAYLKPIPFFVLPFVYRFSTEQINNQLKLLLFLFVIQAPVSLYQRLVQSKDLLTGDLVTGTLNSSGHLTVMLTCAIAILMSFYLAKRITITRFIIIFSLLFIPMTINETKSTLILLPTALMLPMLLSSSNVNIKQYIPMMIIGVLTGIAFVFVYDYFMRPRWGYGLLDFLTMEGRAESYLYKGSETIGNPGPIGKIDTYVLAFRTLSENSLNLLFGLGIGNVSESFISSLSGEYAQKYSAFNVNGTALSLILWELGLLGVLLYYFFFFMVFKDARRLSLHSDFTGALANGWGVVSVIMMLSTAYINVIQENATGYLFWFFSGY
ncbi:MAG: hypothetical protein ACU85E_06655, partial [Gammaproteobacteria bacterium]